MQVVCVLREPQACTGRRALGSFGVGPYLRLRSPYESPRLPFKPTSHAGRKGPESAVSSLLSRPSSKSSSKLKFGLGMKNQIAGRFELTPRELPQRDLADGRPGPLVQSATRAAQVPVTLQKAHPATSSKQLRTVTAWGPEPRTCSAAGHVAWAGRLPLAA